MGRRLIVASVLTGATLAGLLGIASAASPPTGGPIQFYAPATDTPAGTIVFAGAVGDFGKTLSMDKSGKPNTNGNFVKFTLRHGGFVADVTALNQKAAKASPAIVDKATCSFAFGASGPVTLGSGTGLYKGISGRVSVEINFLGDGPLYASGKKKGQCDMRNSTKLLAQHGWITGHGTVSFR